MVEILDFWEFFEYGFYREIGFKTSLFKLGIGVSCFIGNEVEIKLCYLLFELMFWGRYYFRSLEIVEIVCD